MLFETFSTYTSVYLTIGWNRVSHVVHIFMLFASEFHGMSDTLHIPGRPRQAQVGISS